MSPGENKATLNFPGGNEVVQSYVDDLLKEKVGEKHDTPKSPHKAHMHGGGGESIGYTVVSTDKTMGGFTTKIKLKDGTPVKYSEIKSGMTHLASIRKGHFLTVGSEKERFFSEESAGKTRFHEALKKLGVNEIVSPAGVEKI